MTNDEQIAICKAIAVSCMWGQGGIADVILDRLGHALPDVDWWNVYRQTANDAQRESVGVIDSREELDRWLARGYWLTNWGDNGCSLFNPPPMNGLAKYVSKRLADDEQQKRKALQEWVAKAATAQANRKELI